MNRKNAILAAAVGSLFALNTLGTAQAADDAGAKEKCYGVAKAGKNDCGTASHSCAGMAKTDNDPNEWVSMPKDACEKAGGKPGKDKKTM